MKNFELRTGMLAGLASTVLVVSVFVWVERPTQAGGPVRLDEDTCLAILGGNSCPVADCACTTRSCTGMVGGAYPCPTSSLTCVSDGNGGCAMLTSTSQSQFCGTPNTSYNKGCSDARTGILCANYSFSKTQNGPDCSYPTPNNCSSSASCGDSNYTCKQTL